jgi:hypothetical protein
MSIADEERAQNFLVDLREKLQRVRRRLQEAMEELVERKTMLTRKSSCERLTRRCLI